ncbi:outer membrane protein assembly factor BamB family protein [Saccharothrix obliqua]|uniref:outer membrane protein assembly factor BamB family protein n=1 Tax=Saccharothrix obliqua TaxID=2861747 RepID=UPI001C5CC8CD|nr:PQQ-binding-like beta-propeller repeat protein [Saccharothrix obliqua]MBW4718708.1 PQQ-binding-like beta-propeller repeat protein [Saccharothrix obliqua]
MTESEKRPGRTRRLGALAMVIAALFAGVSSADAKPVPAGPVDPAAAPDLTPRWTSAFGRAKYRSSPVVAGDYAYIGDTDGYLTKLPWATGTAAQSPTFTPSWTTNACFNGIYSDPVVGNGLVYVGTAGGVLCAFDDRTGALVWRHFIPNQGWVNGPTLAGNTVYASTHFGDVAAFDALTGTRRWTVNIGDSDAQRPVNASPTALPGGEVYIGAYDGRVVQVAPVHRQLAKFDGRITDAVATDGANLYVSVDKLTAPGAGTVRVASLTPAGQVRWNVETNLGVTWNGLIHGPAVVDGIVYVPTHHNLVYLRSDNGNRVALADTNGLQPTTPAVVNGVAYVGGVTSGEITGALQVFEAKTGQLLYYSHRPTAALTVPAITPDGTVLLGGGNYQGGGAVWAFKPSNAPRNQ